MQNPGFARERRYPQQDSNLVQKTNKNKGQKAGGPKSGAKSDAAGPNQSAIDLMAELVGLCSQMSTAELQRLVELARSLGVG
jgi:hypothetical protein